MIDWIVVGDYCPYLSRIFTHKKRSSHIPGFFYTTPQIITRSYILNNNYTHFHGSRGKKETKGSFVLVCNATQLMTFPGITSYPGFPLISSSGRLPTVKIYAKYAIFGVHKGYIFSWPCHHKSKPWLFYKKPSRATFTEFVFFSRK